MRLLHIVVTVVAVALVAATATPATALPHHEVSLRVHANVATSPTLVAFLPALDATPLGGHAYELFLSRDEFDLLTQAGVQMDVKEHAQPLRAKLAKESAVLPAGYSDLDELTAFLQATAEQYPAIARMIDTSVFGPGRTYQGRTIPAIKISGNVSQEEDEPSVLIDGNIHAREIITPQLTIEIIRKLTTTYATDSVIRQIVDSNAIYIMPTVNPDGYTYMWDADNMWRKNRKPNSATSFGVDINRNFVVGWSASCSGSSVPSSETYKGVAPDSEEETRILMAFSTRYNLIKLLNFHSYGREVLHGYLCTPMATALDNYIVDEAADLATYSNFAIRYPTQDGQHQEWTTQNLTAYSFLVETETEFQPPFADALAEFERVWPLTLRFLQRTIPLSGKITYQGRPVQAAVTVREFNTDITSTSDALFGSYRMFLPDGTWTLVITCPCASTQTRTVSIRNAVPTVLDVAL